jgi:SAM-dependent methyltransferase
VPHSSPEGKEWSAERIVELSPKRILDVGPGVGTYVELLRSFLPDSRWTGLEVYPPYVARYGLEFKYDEVLIGDVRSYDWRTEWDLVIFGDVLEHLELADATRAWQCALRQSTHVLASLPIVHYPQGECGGNVHECHRVTYHHERVMTSFPSVERYWTGKEIGVYLSTNLAAGPRPGPPS